MNDDQHEEIIRLLWKYDKLDEIHIDITEDKFVARVFKGWIDSIDIRKTSFSYGCYGISWECLKPLIDLVEEFGLEMSIHGSKEYEKFYINIGDRIT